METIVLIVVLIFGVLQIVLFFKIWGMTNDVRNIKNHEVDFFKKAQIQLLLGNKQNAYSLFYQSFIKEVYVIYENVIYDQIYSDRYKQIVEKHKVQFTKLDLGFPEFDRFDNRDKMDQLMN